jgi:hypothetical protein
MKKYFALLIFILSLITEACFAQQANGKIDFIKLNVKLWKRPPYYKVNIEIRKGMGEVFVSVNAGTWDKLIIDTTFKIQKEVFVDLSNEVVPTLNKINVLNKTDLPDNTVQVIVDGHNFSIEYGTLTESVVYNIWHPEWDTRERGLTDFLNLCKKIIEIGGLDPNKIL